jgi:mRNA-degrading endonuclease toxin of MazEF toxin-antitoxin module
VKWGEIYRTREKLSERGQKPGYYVVVSRDFVAGNEDLSTVVCAPVYGEFLGLTTEVAVGRDEGLPRPSAIRCDFLTLMFKSKLTGFVATLPDRKKSELKQALTRALQLDR